MNYTGLGLLDVCDVTQTAGPAAPWNANASVYIAGNDTTYPAMSFPSGVGGETLVYDLVVKPGKQLLGFIALTLRCSSGDFIMVALNGGAPVSYGPGLVQTPFTTIPSSFAITPSNYLDPVALSFNVEAQLVNAVTQRWTQNLRTAELVN